MNHFLKIQDKFRMSGIGYIFNVYSDIPFPSSTKTLKYKNGKILEIKEIFNSYDTIFENYSGEFGLVFKGITKEEFDQIEIGSYFYTNFTINCFIDMDGVLCDFDKKSEELREENQVGKWTHIKKYGFYEFFSELEPTKECFEILETIPKDMNKIILTGCTKTDFDKVKQAKIEWIRQYISKDIEIICCFSEEKQNFLRNHGDILIDDNEKNIERWEKSNGKGIHYKDLESLKRLIEI